LPTADCFFFFTLINQYKTIWKIVGYRLKMHGLELRGKEKGREDENFAVSWLPLSLVGVIESIYYFMCVPTLTW
jgi:hypothetical protein